ncbi:MAG: DinB family protein [Burkholderiales bacterium]|nr:DinB family protein [Phycisphaerae bacterium]
MKAIELVRWAMQMSDEATARLVADMRDAPLTQPMPGVGSGGNHPLWILGHLAVIEGGIAQIFFGAEGAKNPVEHWWPLFGPGTEPKPDASLYPSFDEVLSTYRQLRARNLTLLEEIGDAGLDRVPKDVPPGFEDAMKTFGQTLMLIALHNMVHYGQIADARRAAGYKPLM